MNAAISADGRTAYCNLNGARIGVFDLPSGRYVRSFTIKYAQPDSGRVEAIPWQFDPNGHLLFGGFDTGPHPNGVPAGGLGPDDATPANQRLGLVDPHTGRLVAQTGLGDVSGPSAVAWSHDRRLLAVGTFDGTLSLLDARTLHLVASAGAVEPGPIKTVSFAPDDRDLVTAGTGGAMSFWSVPDLSREGGRIAIGSGANNGGLFAWYLPSGDVVGLAPDERHPGTDLQRWFTFRAAPQELAATACSLAGGDMTRGQWARYVGDQPYRRLCQ
jgi:WD40 repeat protein